MGLLIRTDGSQVEVAPQSGPHFSLEEMQGFVGGWIEMVGLPDGRTVVCNEEGKIKGLPYNEDATMIWRRFYGSDVLVGDILIVNEAELEQ